MRFLPSPITNVYDANTINRFHFAAFRVKPESNISFAFVFRGLKIPTKKKVGLGLDGECTTMTVDIPNSRGLPQSNGGLTFKVGCSMAFISAISKRKEQSVTVGRRRSSSNPCPAVFHSNRSPLIWSTVGPIRHQTTVEPVTLTVRPLSLANR